MPERSSFPLPSASVTFPVASLSKRMTSQDEASCENRQKEKLDRGG